MNPILSEKEFQKYILERLEQDNGYVVRKSIKFDRLFAMDREMLFQFLNSTQSEKLSALRKIYKDKAEDTIISFINKEITKPHSSLIEVLKHGVELGGQKLDLMYTKPATDFNPTLTKLYGQNIFSAMEEVWATDDQRIDLVIFLNGFAIMTFELKCNTAGQNYEDAILQYRTQRDPKARLFLFKAGALVNFAMDLQEVHMTTKLNNDATFFMPFNMGRGEGINTGKGNPEYKDKYSVFYMWEDILQKDTVLELLGKFVFVQIREDIDEDTGKKTVKEDIIFPRYHQLDCLRKLLDDVAINKTSLNYLIQHSAGSGKTNTIAWLAHRLASLHDADNKVIYDNIVICTDRVVVDRQLQQAIMGIEHKTGLIRVMDDNCTSDDLRRALEGNTKIIATTIQKFLYIADNTRNLKNKRFAVIIDEAHSSTSGKDMAALTKTLSSDAEALAEPEDFEDKLTEEIKSHGKQENVSMFAFTATPKPTTLQYFGKVNAKGAYDAFHLYSMKQAIEEGFILDVLQNYVCYDTFYRLNKEIEADPRCKTNDAKKQIARFVYLDDTNISQRIEIIVEHFRNTVMQELGGKAKAMVILATREAAVKYRQAFENYITRKGYSDVHALVAFSGTVKPKGEKAEYTESGMNGVSEDRLPEVFDKGDYQVLLVANKYQVGYDQPKLCAMYVLKKLRDVAAVQTLSRLNRVYPPFKKKTFVLDFVNDYATIQKAFSRYYTATFLANSITPKQVYELEAKIDGYFIIDPADIDSFNTLLLKNKAAAKDKKEIAYYLGRAKNKVEQLDQKGQQEFMLLLRHFIRFYEFLIQATCFEDIELHKKYKFIDCLYSFIGIKSSGGGFNLDGMVKATSFVQKKSSVHKDEKIHADPYIKLPTAEDFGLSPEKEQRLSEIIRDINSRTGKAFDSDVATKAMLQIKDILLKDERLKSSAKTNSLKDFEFSFYDGINNALVEGWSQNQDFFTLLLDNENIKKEVLGIFFEEIYRSLRASDEEG